MMKSDTKKIVKLLTSFVILFSFLVVPCYAVFYDESFPYTNTGVTGGAFITCNSSIGDISILIPYNYRENYLTFTTSGNLFNASSNTISCAVYKNGVKYSARFPSFDTLEYRPLNDYSFFDLTTSSITSTNVVFLGESEGTNDNYYFNDFEIFTLCVLISILFFVFLNWFLLHKIR